MAHESTMLALGTAAPDFALRAVATGGIGGSSQAVEAVTDWREQVVERSRVTVPLTQYVVVAAQRHHRAFECCRTHALARGGASEHERCGKRTDGDPSTECD